MSVKVAALTKIYGTKRALDEISFEVQPGTVLGFLGPNGAGKSTTMKILSGYIPQSGGNAWVCGFDVLKQSIEVRKNIGYLPESNPLYYDMYVKEYLTFTAGMYGMGAKANRAAEEMIGKTGLGPERSKKIGQLSKGYKQRVGLAAALIHDPKVLILDEPTSGLDPNQIIEIREVIKQQGKNKTVLFSTHILQEVEDLCDRVIIINKGEIVADDKLSNLQKGRAGLVVKVKFQEPVEKNLLQQLDD